MALWAISGGVELKLTAVYGAMPSFDHGLSRVNSIIYETFKELGETVAEQRLNLLELPFYGGIPAVAVERIIGELVSSDGIILSFAANLFAPCSVMQVFLEHLSDEKFSGSFKDKNVFLITSSSDNGESSALAYVSRIVNALGGYCAVTLGLNSRLVENIDDEFKTAIEKYAEDYYRIVRQNRRFIIPGDASVLPRLKNANAGARAKLSHDEVSALTGAKKPPKVTASELIKNLDMDSFTQKQEQDIDEITKYFANKYKEDIQNEKPSSGPVIKEELKKSAPPAPRAKTCRQMTQNLLHYYQPQLASGLNACIQFSIAGDENFDGYLTIKNTECDYAEGVAQNPDLSILCDAAVWTDVLKGKFTAQKAFMTGNLKVRGNFVLLTKFDQLFKLA